MTDPPHPPTDALPRTPAEMRWMLGLTVLLGLLVQNAWAQAQVWAEWSSTVTNHAASGTVQTLNGPVAFTFAIDPTTSGTANGGYFITGVNPGGIAFNNVAAFGPNPPASTRCVRA
jgi:hypothetical protein